MISVSYTMLSDSYPMISDSYPMISDSYPMINVSYPITSDSYPMISDSCKLILILIVYKGLPSHDLKNVTSADVFIGNENNKKKVANYLKERIVSYYIHSYAKLVL